MSMAKRRNSKTKRSRSRKSAISLIGLVETYMLLNVATRTLFNNDPVNFIMGKDGAASGGSKMGGGSYGSTTSLNIKELFGQGSYQGYGIHTGVALQGGFAATPLGVMGHNLRNNWVSGAAGMILIPMAFRFGKKLMAPAVNRSNALLRKAVGKNTIKL